MKTINKYIIFLLLLPIIMLISCKEDDPTQEFNPLTAKAGDDKQAVIGATVNLDGSASQDIEGENFSFLWTIKNKPAGSQVTLNGEETATPGFIPDKPGVFLIELTIRKAQWSAKDEVQVTVSEIGIPQVIEISEDITSDMVLEDIFTEDWHKIDYLVTKPVRVESRLSIKPGVRIAFAKDAAFTITYSGSFISEGGEAEESMIYLTGETETPGFWGGLQFQSAAEVNKMVYTSLSFAGANSGQEPFSAAILLESGSRMGIEHSVFIDNSEFGVYVSSGAELKTFKSNYIKGATEGGHGIAVPAKEVKKISGDCMFLNGNVAVITADLTDGENHEWGVFDFNLQKGLNIINGTGIQLHGGTRFFIAPDERIAAQNGGHIIAIGTDARPVLFKGEEEVAGYWKGIFIENSGDHPSRFEHASIWGAGSSALAGNQPASLHLGQQGKAVVESTAINLGAGDGVEATSEGAILLSFNENVIRGHQGYPMAVSTRNVAVIDPSTVFTNNTLYQIRVDGNYPVASDQETIWKGFANVYMSYHIKGMSKDLVIWSGLKLAEGVVLEMEPESRIVVEDANGRQGYLNIAGTSTKNVVVKGFSNTPGSWYGITISSDNVKNRFEYANILHGGKKVDNSFSANIVVDNSPEGTLTIVNSTVGYSGQHGISVLNDKRGNLSDSNISFVGIPEANIYAW